MQVTVWKSSLISSQVISVSIALETGNSASLSHTYILEKTHIEVSLESWHSS